MWIVLILSGRIADGTPGQFSRMEHLRKNYERLPHHPHYCRFILFIRITNYDFSFKMRKQRKSSRATLVRKLDKLCAKIILERDNYTCVICGSTKSPGWGHLFSRRTYNTRWDMFNGHCQCWGCNYKHVRDQYPYLKWFEDKYGKQALKELRQRYTEVKRWTIQDLKDKLEELENL